MSKKIILSGLCLILILSTAACGSSSTSTASVNSEASAGTTAAEATANDEIVESEVIETESPAGGDEITFENLTVIDNEDCTIEITGIDLKNNIVDSLPVFLENKSEDVTYMFSLKSISVNDIEISDIFAKEVAPGKKANSEIDILDSDLKEAGITEYTDIELAFRVYNSDDWSADDIANVTVHVYPYGEEKAVSYVREERSSDMILADNEYVTIIVTGYDPDSSWGYAVDLYLVNKSDTEVMYSVDDASINGFMLDPFYATSVSPGKCKFSSMSWSNSKLEENSIDKIEEIEFTLRAHDYSDWKRDDFVNEVITLNP